MRAEGIERLVDALELGRRSRTWARHSSVTSPRRPVETMSTALMLRSVFRASASALLHRVVRARLRAPDQLDDLHNGHPLSPFPRMLPRRETSVLDLSPDELLSTTRCAAPAARSRAAHRARGARGVPPPCAAGAYGGVRGGLALRRRHRRREAHSRSPSCGAPATVSTSASTTRPRCRRWSHPTASAWSSPSSTSTSTCTRCRCVVQRGTVHRHLVQVLVEVDDGLDQALAVGWDGSGSALGSSTPR